MPTSTSTVTRDSIVKRALRKLGNTNPSNQELTDGIEALNIIVKRIDVEGKWLWAISNTETQLSIVGSQQTYSTGTAPTGIASDILELETFDLLLGNIHTPLRILRKREAVTTWWRDGSSQPYEVYLEKATMAANNTLWVFPTPSGDYSGRYTYRRRLYDFTAATDNPDFPQEWNDVLTYQLAADLIEEYNTPEPQATRLLAKSSELLKLMKKANAEAIPVNVPSPTQYF